MPGADRGHAGRVERVAPGMNITEEPLVFPVAGEALLGLAALPEAMADCGVLVVVGGPQYRIGSHRQFLLLSRRLAAAGYPVLRFDYRGMGDSGGAQRDFDEVTEDIGAAMDAFFARCPAIRRVVLWGLCDAASASLLYVESRHDARVAGLALLNPWLRSEATLARARLRHYYLRRLVEPAFWTKLVSGELKIAASIRDLLRNALLARTRTGDAGEGADRSRPFQVRMADGMRCFQGSVLILLSENDLVAREFEMQTRGAGERGENNAWAGLRSAQRVCRRTIPGADHTFSTAQWRNRVETETLDWLCQVLAASE